MSLPILVQVDSFNEDSLKTGKSSSEEKAPDVETFSKEY
jgi:hypothetical protein